MAGNPYAQSVSDVSSSLPAYTSGLRLTLTGKHLIHDEPIMLSNFPSTPGILLGLA